MNSLNWIKSIYAFYLHASVPSLLVRRIAIGISASFGLYAWMRFSNGVPMLFTLVLGYLMFTSPINRKFFFIVSISVQLIIQTIRIVIMAFLYYTAFALYASYFRKKHLASSSFATHNLSSFKKINAGNLNWKKMF